MVCPYLSFQGYCQPQSLLKSVLTSDPHSQPPFPVGAKPLGGTEKVHADQICATPPGQNSSWRLSLGQGQVLPVLPLTFSPGAPLVTQVYGAAYLLPQLQGEPLSPH